MKLKKFLQNFSLTIASNFLSLITSVIVILVVPKTIGVYEYGLWQLFIFYSSYIGVLHFGWIDGIYLRYGGITYKGLDKSAMAGQFLYLLVSQAIVTVLMISITNFMFVGDTRIILINVAGAIVLVNMKSFFQFVLQMTNRINEYAISNFLSSIVYIIVLLALISMGIKDYQFFIWSFFCGQLFSLIYCGFTCKDILLSKPTEDMYKNLREAKKNVRVGSKLLISNIAGLLVIGIVRFGIQNTWDVKTFGKISLVLSLSNFLMIFIGAVSLVLFPILRRVDVKIMHNIYMSLQSLLLPVIFLGLFMYFPIIALIPKWLPNYSSALTYMSLLFPVIIYQSKFELLSNTFFKVLRMEKILMILNGVTVVLSLILTFFATYVFKNLTIAVFNILIVMFIRGLISEKLLGRKMELV